VLAREDRHHNFLRDSPENDMEDAEEFSMVMR
jgi:hypothetical protein